MNRRGLAAIAALMGLASGAPAAASDPVETGARVYARECVVCHSPGTPSTALLQDRYKGSVSALLEERSDLKPDQIKTVIRSFRPRMPAFRPTEVTDEELAALVTYLTRNNQPEE